MIHCSGIALRTTFVPCAIRQNLEKKKNKVKRQLLVHSRKIINSLSQSRFSSSFKLAVFLIPEDSCGGLPFEDVYLQSTPHFQEQFIWKCFTE